MRTILIANKAGLYIKLLSRIEEAASSVRGMSQKDYVPFPIIFEKLCRGFSIKKAEAWECLFLLREFGFIEIIKFRGVKLNFRIKNVKSTL